MTGTPENPEDFAPDLGVHGPKVDEFTLRVRQIIGDRSVRKFAKRAGLGPTTMQNIVDGARPTVDKLVAIARAGGVTVDWLATGSGDPTAIPGEAFSEERFEGVSARLDKAREVYEQAEREVRWRPPPEVAENIKSALFDASLGGPKVERVVQLLDALKRWHKSDGAV